MGFKGDQFLWTDRKRVMGLPLSFTRYALSADRLFQSVGLLNIKDEECLLYRVRDISMSRSLYQRIFGMGTNTVASSDKSTPVLALKNIKNPQGLKELLHQKVEDAKIRRRVRYSELMADNHGMDDLDQDNDGIPDDLE